MAKEPTNAPEPVKEAEARRVDTSVEGVTFESPVPVQENVGPVSDEKAKEINGYKGHKNIGTQVVEKQESKGRSRDDETYTGAKFF